MNQNKNPKQGEIDWTKAVHSTENNKFSQKNLDKHRHKFTGQAAIVSTLLGENVRLTADYAREVYGIKHLARRVGDLGEAGIDIDREWGLNKELEQEDMLVYFIPERRQEFIDKKWIINRPYRWWYSDKYTPTLIINEIKKQQDERSKSKGV